MGRAHQLYPQAPISSLLQQSVPTQAEITILTLMAAMDEDHPQAIAGSSHPLTNLFNQCDNNIKQSCIQFAQAYLGDITTRLPPCGMLNDLTGFLTQLITHTPMPNKVRLAERIGHDGILKAAMINPQLATAAFELLLLPLSRDRKKWLYFTLHIEQLIKEISINQETFSGPSQSDVDKPYVSKLIMLHYHWPQLRHTFKALLDKELEALGPHVLSQTTTQFQQLLQSEISTNVTPFLARFNPIKPAQSRHILQAVAHLNADELAWFTFNCYNSELLAFGPILETMPNDHYNRLSQQFNALVRQYGRESLLVTLHEKNSAQINQTVMGRVNENLDKIVKDLSYNARYWLFLSLILEDNTDSFPYGLKEPNKRQKQACEKLLQLGYACPTITRLIHQRLVARIPKGKEIELFDVIIRFVRDKASTFPEQMRLWQYLSLVTHATPSFFAMMGGQIHERVGGTIIYRTILSPLSELFVRMSQYSPFLSKTIQHALLNNVQHNPGFEKAVSDLGLYQDHQFNTLLKSCDLNTQCWLYFALMTNMHSQTNLVLGEKFTIIPPIERQALHANQVLDICVANRDATKALLKVLELTIPSGKVQLLKAFNLRFLKAKLEKISVDAKKWLYFALNTLSIEEVFQAHSKNPIALPAVEANNLAKILYLLDNDTNLIQTTKGALVEMRPELAALTPQDDNFGFFAYNQSQSGEFCSLISLSEQRSLELVPFLLKSTAKATKNWLKESLTSGIIDSRVLLQALPSQMSEHIDHELSLVPDLLTLALQWPSVRARLIHECGGSIDNIQPVSQLIIDKLHFSEKGMINLVLALQPQCAKLTHFSAVNAGLTDEALLLFSDLLIGKAPLKVLQLHHNASVSGKALARIIPIANKRIGLNDQAFVSTALVYCLQDPYVLGWLLLKLQTLDNPYESTLQNNASFYMPNHLQDQFTLAHALFEDCKLTPAKRENVIRHLKLITSPLIVDDQLAHSAVQSKQADFVHHAMLYICNSLKSNHVKQWLNTTLLTGKIEIDNTLFSSEEEMIFAIQLSCLLLVSSKDQRFALGQSLGMSIQGAYPDITDINIRRLSLSPCQLSMLLNAINHNENKLNKITLEALSLDTDAIANLTQSLKTKTSLRSLDLSVNPITQQGAGMVAQLLKANHAIKELTMNHCQCGEEGFIEIVNNLSQTNLEHLSAHNSQETWASYKPVKDKGIKALIKALDVPNCPLKQLDISYNEVGNLSAQQLFTHLAKSAAGLKSLKLNHNNIGDLGLIRLGDVIEAKTALQKIDVDGHHAKPKTLEALAQKLTTNSLISHFEAKPNYLLDQDDDEMTEDAQRACEILTRIKDTISQNAQEKLITKKIRRLKLSEDDAMPVDDYPLRRCSSLPAFEISKGRANTQKRSDRVQKVTSSWTPHSASLSRKFTYA